jgi:hypothetical protein
VGVVVERHTTPAGDEGYSVEFFDLTWQTLAVVVVRADQLRAPISADAMSRTSAGPPKSAEPIVRHSKWKTDHEGPGTER